MPRYIVVWITEHAGDFIQEADTPEQAVNQFVDRNGDGADEKFYAIELTDDMPKYQLRAARVEE